MINIKNITAREILDSRGNPTLEVDVYGENGFARAAVPSGASTGAYEAVELRDGDKKRYGGKGVKKAVDNVQTLISKHLIGMDAADQEKIDRKLIEIDGSENKSVLGANALLGVSMAVAKLAALEKKQPLFEYFSTLAGFEEARILPIPMMNIVNGGRHADSGLNIQEFMIAPTGANNFSEGLRFGAEIFQTLKEILHKKGLSTSVGDEGGFAPHITSHREVLETIMDAVEMSGHAGSIHIALDCAASEFYKDGKYEIEGEKYTAAELVAYYEKLFQGFPVFSVEDSHAEDDLDGFHLMHERFGEELQLVGDDLFVTNTKRIQMGIDQKLANAILIKLNQIGTITETIEAIKLGNSVSWNSIISHRSGETEDTTIADFSVGLATGQIKTGSLSRSDRVCKYNQLLRIEEALGEKALYGK